MTWIALSIGCLECSGGDCVTSLLGSADSMEAARALCEIEAKKILDWEASHEDGVFYAQPSGSWELSVVLLTEKEAA